MKFILHCKADVTMLKFAALLFIASIILSGPACQKTSCESCIIYGWTFDINGQNYKGSDMISAVSPDSNSFLIDGPLNDSKDSIVFGLDLFFSVQKLNTSFDNFTPDSTNFALESPHFTYSSWSYDNLVKTTIDSFIVSTQMMYGHFSGKCYTGSNPTLLPVTNGKFIVKLGY